MDIGLPTLSIGIPTYDRAPYLRNTLTSLAREFAAGDFAGTVEIVVSDNASPDDTLQVINEFREILPLRYYRNDENVGFDRNVLKLLSYANGEFIWLLGDDDLVEPGFIGRLIAHIQENNCDIFLLSFPDNIEHNQRIGIEMGFTQPCKSIVAPLHEFIKRNGLFYQIGTMSLSVFRRRPVLELGVDFEIGSNFVHIFFLAHTFLRREACLLLEAGFSPVPKIGNFLENSIKRWDSDGYNAGILMLPEAFLRLADRGLIEEKPPRMLFRMWASHLYPVHWEVCRILVETIFRRQEPIAGLPLSALERFFRMWDAPEYLRLFGDLLQAFEAWQLVCNGNGGVGIADRAGARRLDGSISASSVVNQDPGLGPAGILHGQNSHFRTIWHSQNPPVLPEWIVVRFPQSITVDCFWLRSQEGYSERAPTSFDLQAGDGEHWVTLLSIDGLPWQKRERIRIYRFYNQKAWSFYRLLIREHQSPSITTVEGIGLECYADPEPQLRSCFLTLTSLAPEIHACLTELRPRWLFGAPNPH